MAEHPRYLPTRTSALTPTHERTRDVQERDQRTNDVACRYRLEPGLAFIVARARRCDCGQFSPDGPASEQPGITQAGEAL